MSTFILTVVIVFLLFFFRESRRDSEFYREVADSDRARIAALEQDVKRLYHKLYKLGGKMFTYIPQDRVYLIRLFMSSALLGIGIDINSASLAVPALILMILSLTRVMYHIIYSLIRG